MEATRVYERMWYHVSLTPAEAKELSRMQNSSSPVLADLAVRLEGVIDRQ